jgi:cystathionine beta-lyase/cystathionine gamma-synthase
LTPEGVLILSTATFYNPETLVAHADRGIDVVSDVAPPIHQTAPFRASSDEEFAAMSDTPRHDRNYTRDGNPTFSRVEAVIAALEGAEAALLTASGMGAISTSVLALLSSGDHVVAQRTHYMGTAQLLASVLPRFGITVTLVDQARPEAFADAITPRTKLILVETPANPMLTITDLASVGRFARARGIATLCDSTIATPVNQRPLELGIDLVVHSATKFLGGHHDLMAGVVAGSSALIDRIWHMAVTLGPVADPFAAWLLLRGLRTLPLRVARQNQTALDVARFLERHPAVLRVHYPGLESHAQHALARQQMPGGFGGLMSVELRTGFDGAQAFLGAMGLVSRAVSFGGFESLATQPGAMWSGSVGASKAAEAGISAGLVRLSIGLEHPSDLIADLDRALHAAAKGASS